MAAVYSATVLGTSVYLLLWLFFIYCFMGVLIEGIFCLLCRRRVELRLGLLYLPFRPIYGFGGAGCALFLDRYAGMPVVVFLLGMLICTVVEYVASLTTDKAFGTVSWDYSDNLLNLHGRFCLKYSLAWGALALLAVYVLNPFVSGLVSGVDERLGHMTLTVLLTLTLLSVVLTAAALARVRVRVDAEAAQARGEAATVPDSARDRLVDRLAPDAVLVNSFPRMRLMWELKQLRQPAARPNQGQPIPSAR